MSVQQQRLALATYIMARSAIKLVNPQVSTPSHRVVAMIVDCAGKERLDWFLTTACLGISQKTLSRQLNSEVAQLDSATTRFKQPLGMLVLLYDNVRRPLRPPTHPPPAAPPSSRLHRPAPRLCPAPGARRPLSCRAPWPLAPRPPRPRRPPPRHARVAALTCLWDLSVRRCTS